MKVLVTILISLLLHPLLSAQTEQILKQSLEGKRIEVLIEMPASAEGINIRADRQTRMDFGEYSDRIKKYGIALYPGDVVMITKIKKKSKHIEFQLAGGGYGTFGDDDGTITGSRIPKSSRETELENLLNDDDKEVDNRSQLKKELNDLRRQREIQQDQADRDAALQNEMKQSRLQEKRKQGGSRFNIRYDYKVSGAELTGESIKEALREYVNFDVGGNTQSGGQSGQMSDLSGGQLEKGISMQEAMTIFGMPTNLVTDKACDLERTTCTFEKDTQLIEAIFVEKVLVKYTVSSQ